MSLRLIPLKIKNHLKKKRQLREYRGDQVECVICGNSFREFMPFGVPPARIRQNACCPNCSSLERTRMYWHYLTNQKDLKKVPRKILHTAPERSLMQKFLALSNIDYQPIDKFFEGYTYPPPTLNMDITDIKFEDNTFDFILSSHVLEHVLDDRKAMSEFYRVMKPGGFGLLQVPIEMDREETYEDDSIVTPEERAKAFGQHDHVRIYGKDYVDRLKEAGFEVEVLDYSKLLSSDEMHKYGFAAEDILFVVTKN